MVTRPSGSGGGVDEAGDDNAVGNERHIACARLSIDRGYSASIDDPGYVLLQ